MTADEITQIRLKVLNTVTEYDRKQANKRGYNPYALPQYIGKIEDLCIYLHQGMSLKRAIMKCYLGRLCVAVGKPFGIQFSNNEIKFGILETE